MTVKSLTAKQIRDMFPGIAYTGKGSYALPDKTWIEEQVFPTFKEFVTQLLKSFKWDDDSQCTFFAAAFRIWVHACYARTFKGREDLPAAPAVAEFHYIPDDAEPGTGHAINAVFCDDNKVRFIEPQGPAWVGLSSDERDKWAMNLYLD